MPTNGCETKNKTGAKRFFFWFGSFIIFPPNFKVQWMVELYLAQKNNATQWSGFQQFILSLYFDRRMTTNGFFQCVVVLLIGVIYGRK
jgi:hypothetical protein